MISINCNPLVITTQRNINHSNNYINEAIQRLSTGLRINKPKDDPAGYVTASRLNSEIRGLAVCQNNVEEGINFAQTAYDSLTQMNNIMERIKNLALQGSSDALDTEQKQAIQRETDELLTELFRLKDKTTFNKINVFGTDKTGSISSGSSSAGKTITHMQGANSSLSSSIKITNGTIKVGSGAVIDATGKTLGQIVNEINAQKISGVTASIKDGKFTISSEKGIQTISVSGDFARVTELGNYTVSPATQGTENKMLSKTQGSNDSLTGTETIVGGSIKIGSAAAINTKGKTLNQIVTEINNQAVPFVTASIENGKFTISTPEGTAITAGGDFARVTGLAEYTVAEAQSVTTTTCNYTGLNSSLTGNETIVSGSVQIGTAAVINTKGKTLNQIVTEINAQGIAGVTASIKDGKFTITTADGSTPVINATGDFARVTRLADYVVNEGSFSAGTLIGSVDTRVLTGSAFSGQRNGSITFSDGTVVNISSTDSLNTIITKFNNAGLNASINSNGQISITNSSSDDLYVEFDDSGVSKFYGLTTHNTKICEQDAIEAGYTIIKTAADLDNIRNNLSGKYMLFADIDLSAYDNWDPIGSVTDGQAHSFSGTLDGNGYTIKNLTISKSDGYVGLFGTSQGAVFENVIIENADIKGGYYVGAITGQATNCTITNSSVSGTISGVNYVGGLIGQTNSGSITIENSHFSGTVSNTGSDTGGLIGALGYASATITNCYVTGSIDATSSAAGLVGSFYRTLDIQNCYVDANTLTDKAICGSGSGLTISNTNFNSDKSSMDGRENEYDNVKGLTTAQMADAANYNNWDTSLWDFSGSGTPVLKDSQKINHLISYAEGGIDANIKYEAVLTGTVNTKELSGGAFYGQQDGTMIFSDGTEINISANDTLNSFITKLNNAGLNASVNNNGNIEINALVDDFYIKSDTSGVAKFYGLLQDATTENTKFTITVDKISEADAISQGYTIIKSAYDLNNIRNNLSGKYILMSDIDLASIDNWQAIGDSNSKFSGVFNGNGYVIKNLTIDNSANSGNGLFGYTNNAEIKNVGLENVNIKGNSSNGAVAADADATKIENIYVTGTINGTSVLNGAICGTMDSGSSITNSYASADVIGGTNTGGLTGRNDGTISASSFTGNITANGSYIGGIAGSNYGTISNAYVSGTITNISNGSATYTGGIAGSNYNSCVIQNSYMDAEISALYFGGVVGYSSKGTVSNVVWNTTKSKTSVQYTGNSTNTNCNGVMDSEIKNAQNYDGWDTNIWEIQDGTMPSLKDSNLQSIAYDGLYSGTSTVTDELKTFHTLTGSIDTSLFTGEAFYGQKTGTMTFSDGSSISVSASDSLNQILNKLNIAGLVAQLTDDNKIKILTLDSAALSVTSDDSGFADFYGLTLSGKTYTGSITNTTETIDSDEDAPPFNEASLITTGVSNLRIQVSACSADYAAVFIDTTFLFDRFSLDLSDADSAAQCADQIDILSKAATKKISEIGIYLTRLNSIAENNIIKAENLSSAYSAVTDADIAQETQKYVKNQIISQTAAALLAQIEATRSQNIIQMISALG